MTTQEAIKWLDKELKQWEAECKSLHPTKDALRVAIKALEKQIPKKPLTTKMTYKDTGGERIITTCPYCRQNEGLGLWDSLIDRGTLYCHRCGQAIDWSDMNE